MTVVVGFRVVYRRGESTAKRGGICVLPCRKVFFLPPAGREASKGFFNPRLRGEEQTQDEPLAAISAAFLDD